MPGENVQRSMDGPRMGLRWVVSDKRKDRFATLDLHTVDVKGILSRKTKRKKPGTLSSAILAKDLEVTAGQNKNNKPNTSPINGQNRTM